jgi:hypothetical protein
VGDLDIAAANRLSDDLTILKNNGSAIFTASQVVRLREDPFFNVSVLINVEVALPSVAGFSPTSGPVGTLVTITGANFTGASAVTFGGAGARSFAVLSATQIQVRVPRGATTGKIVVTTPAGNATSAGNFSVTPRPGR